MPTHKQLHLFEAKSADTRISRDQPTVARVNFSLTNGESLVIEVPRYALERLLVRAKRLEPIGRSAGAAFSAPLFANELLNSAAEIASGAVTRWR